MRIPFLFLLLLLAACGPAVAPDEIKVIGIADGDTFTAMKGREKIRVRLEGIDCPERGQAFGKRAGEALGDMIFGKVVRLEERGKDRYGRVLAVAWLEDGRCVNEEMLRLGMAWHFKRYNKDRRWAEMETEARLARQGLWADKNPVAPWEWRGGK
ncbi:MAG: thermonuclease family protein [Saprospirales bacterium]|jgi:micrococcal nuclease|nr:thermonuclease family protein [Saprospirales bacterium]